MTRFSLATIAGIASASLWFSSAMADGVLSYHNGPSRSGAYVVPGLTHAAAASMRRDRRFQASISGAVYAQPLSWQSGDRAAIIVGTGKNQVYSLDAASGAVIWRKHLGRAVRRSELPCGNIDPEGITGTPVMDAEAGTIYLNALTRTGGVIRQMLHALSAQTGASLPGWPLDVESALAAKGISFSSAHQGQRSSLLWLGDKVYVAYGGKYGDCLPYRGTVVEVDPRVPAISGIWQTRAAGGGIWAQAGIAADADALYVTTGNTFGATSYGDGESVVRLTPGLARSSATADFYAPPDWRSLDSADLDLGGTAAVPVDLPKAGGGVEPHLIAFGKDGKAYLLNRANLGGIGGPATIAALAAGEIITAPAIYSTHSATMVALTNPRGIDPRCAGNTVMMLRLTGGTNPSIVPAWCAPYSGDGSPIITTTDGTANPIVWVAGAEGDNLLHGFNALTGESLFGGGGFTLRGVRHLATLLAANGRLYIGADRRVYAYRFTPG